MTKLSFREIKIEQKSSMGNIKRFKTEHYAVFTIKAGLGFFFNGSSRYPPNPNSNRVWVWWVPAKTEH